MTTLNDLRLRVRIMQQECRDSMEQKTKAMVDEWAVNATERVQIGEHTIKLMPVDIWSDGRVPTGEVQWIAGAFVKGGSLFHLPIRVETEMGTVISAGPIQWEGLDVRVLGFMLRFQRREDCSVRLMEVWPVGKRI